MIQWLGLIKTQFEIVLREPFYYKLMSTPTLGSMRTKYNSGSDLKVCKT